MVFFLRRLPTSASLHPRQPNGSPSNRIWVDFTGQYTGSQLLLTLEQGSNYDPGGVTAPSEALIELFPDLADDSFVTLG